MSKSGSDTITERLSALGDVLSAELRWRQAAHKNPGIRGDAAEIPFRRFLKEHLPRQFEVGHGEVIDLQGKLSKQLDVVITNGAQPFSPTDEGDLLIMEAVHAAGEVKTKLTTTELTDAIKKAKSLAALTAVRLETDQVFTNDEDRWRWVDQRPPFFVFAYSTDVKIATLLRGLKDAPVDAVFVLGRGAAIDYGEGAGNLQLGGADGNNVTGWAWLEGVPVPVQALGWLNSLPFVMHNTPPFTRYLRMSVREDQVQIPKPG